jgi:transcriptional regulator with XRE-family HTH domain
MGVGAAAPLRHVPELRRPGEPFGPDVMPGLGAGQVDEFWRALRDPQCGELGRGVFYFKSEWFICHFVVNPLLGRRSVVDSFICPPYAALQAGRCRAADVVNVKEEEGMPAKRKDDDGPVTGVQAFAAELRAQREAAGLTQAQLAKLMGYSESVIAKLETCRTIPSPQHAAQADGALRTPGTFRRLRQAMLNGSYESWIRALLEMEERATVLRNWEPLVVPGLLQTEDYARAMIRAGRPGDSDAEVEQLVIARISRQAIWDRTDPPPAMLFAVLGEAILRQFVGDARIMRDQLIHLAEMAKKPRITVQVLPFAAAAHPGMLGPFLVASFAADRDAAYLDNALDGQVTERRNQVARISLLYDSLRSVALSPGESMELIMKVVDGTWRT